MKTIHTRKGGIPALASATDPVREPLFCTLKILNQDVQFGVILELVLPNHGVGNKRLYQLHCGGGNLVPGENSLTKWDTPLSHELSMSLLRLGESRPGTLSLSLKQPCPLWYPVGHSNLDADCRKLLELARSPQIRILFDTAWLSSKNLTQLKCILAGSQEFASVPVLPNFKISHKEVDWPIINLMQDTAPEAYVPAEDQAPVVMSSIEHAEAEVPPFQDVEYDSPPPYSHVSGKRSRHTDPGLTPDAHDSKRAREDSYSHSETKGATPGPSLHAESIASSTTTVPVDLFQRAVNSAVERVLSYKLKKEMIQVVKEGLLPVLDEHLRKTPTEQSPSSPASPHCRVLSTPTHHDATPTHHPTLIAIIKEAVTTAVHKSLDKTFYDAVDQSCNSATIHLEEYSTDLKFDLAVIKEDHLANCNEEMNGMLAEFEQRLGDHLGNLEARAEKIVFQTEDRLDVIRNRALSIHQGILNAPEQGQRSKSLPVSNESRKIIANGS